ncbi:cytosolic protein, partial [Planococcus sp. Sa1BUA13]|nr:cytosolic protein [Planococcus wigleyi]
MTLLTAYNQDVQRYFQGSYCNKIRKETILSTIEEKVFKMGKSFGQLFPNKRKQVLDEIIYLLSGRGICKIGADKLAEKVNCSVRTVKSAVASIKETDQLVVARLADDKAGKYIFVYKEHPNFHQILKEVFFLDSLPVSDAVAPPFAPLVAPLQNAEPVEAVGVEGQKTSSNHINSFNSLQERDSIQQA